MMEYTKEEYKLAIEYAIDIVEATQPLLQEISRRAYKECADDGNEFTVTITPELYNQIKPYL